jgi:hypothetical protein
MACSLNGLGMHDTARYRRGSTSMGGQLASSKLRHHFLLWRVWCYPLPAGPADQVYRSCLSFLNGSITVTPSLLLGGFAGTAATGLFACKQVAAWYNSRRRLLRQPPRSWRHFPRKDAVLGSRKGVTAKNPFLSLAIGRSLRAWMAFES